MSMLQFSNEEKCFDLRNALVVNYLQWFSCLKSLLTSLISPNFFYRR